jgi:hypothetical protein
MSLYYSNNNNNNNNNNTYITVLLVAASEQDTYTSFNFLITSISSHTVCYKWHRVGLILRNVFLGKKFHSTRVRMPETERMIGVCILEECIIFWDVTPCSPVDFCRCAPIFRFEKWASKQARSSRWRQLIDDLQDWVLSIVSAVAAVTYAYLFAEMVKHEGQFLRLQLYFDGFLGYDTV